MKRWIALLGTLAVLATGCTSRTADASSRAGGRGAGGR